MKRILLASVLIFLLTACKKELLHSIPEDQANDILALLTDYGIRADKLRDERQETPSFNIVVEESDYSRAWTILRENGLPREKIRGLSEVYQKQGLISSSMEEQALLIQAIKGEVEKTLETIDNVIKARVIISIPNQVHNPFDESKGQMSASVLLKVKKGSYINKEMVKGILTGALCSLDKERISVEVVESAGSSISKTSKLNSIGPFLMPESSAKLFYIVTIVILLLISIGLVVTLLYFYRKKVFVSREVEEL